jgi:hypothetical protein
MQIEGTEHQIQKTQGAFTGVSTKIQTSIGMQIEGTRKQLRKTQGAFTSNLEGFLQRLKPRDANRTDYRRDRAPDSEDTRSLYKFISY